MSLSTISHTDIIEMIRKSISDFDFAKFDALFKAAKIEWYRGPELLRSDVFSVVLPLAKLVFDQCQSKPMEQFTVSVGTSFIHVYVSSCDHNSNLHCSLAFVFGGGNYTTLR